MTPARESRAVIIVRHGIMSDRQAMAPIERTLDIAFGASVTVDNDSYDSKLGVLENAAILATHILDRYPSRKVVLIGHSMGGLIARCANLALSSPQAAASYARQEASSLSRDELRPVSGNPLSIVAEYQLPPEIDRYRTAAGRAQALGSECPHIAGVLMLATPNSGAITPGQIASYTNLLKLWKVAPAAVSGDAAHIVKAIAQSGQAAYQLLVRGAYGAFNMRLESAKDLTSDRLFRFFQHFTVETPCVTISGSLGNALTTASATGGLIKMSGIDIAKPHDGVVAEDSVDLRESVLPHEFRNHKHYRRYFDCVDAHHCNLYTKEAVKEIIRKTVRDWIS